MAAAKKAALADTQIDVKLKLAAAWASLMFCYVYGDYFGLYRPGKLDDMLRGRMGPLGEVTQGVLLGTSIMMAIPALMVFLCVVVKPAVSRWLNVFLGLAYAAIMALTMRGGAWNFYLFFGVVEIALCLLIVWQAWKWPRAAA